MKTKFILLLLKAFINLLVEVMRESEKDVDADGIPFDSEYEEKGYLLAMLCDVQTKMEKFENEK